MSSASRDPFVLRTERLSKTYDDGLVRALDDVTVTIAHGEYVAITGPSGSGKSTLLHLLGCLDRPSSGEVFFDGRPLSAEPDLDRLRAEKIGFVFQSFYLLPTLTAHENVRVPMFETAFSPRERKQRADLLLSLVGLSNRRHRLPKQLSVGERQRVAIARALANAPSVLLADEPTGNLDSRTMDDVLNLLAKLHQQQRVTLVVVTHSPQVAERAQRILHVEDGRVVADVWQGQAVTV
jgi:putative ABC transport system ATP-binding protein